MQNSGLGNALNPLVSLTDKLVYSIPVLLIVGWRGEPNKKDEPQHKKQGLVTIEILDILSIKYDILENNTSNDEMRKKIRKANNYMKENNEPYALVVKKDTFDEYQIKYDKTLDLEMTREDAIAVSYTHL